MKFWRNRQKYFKENLDNTANVKEIIYDDGTKFYRFNTYSDTSSAPLGNTIKEAQKGLYKKILNNIDYTNSKTTRPFYRVFLNIINPYVWFKGNDYNKEEIINVLVQFENNPINNDIFLRRQSMWYYIDKLKNDKFMKKYVLW